MEQRWYAQCYNQCAKNAHWASGLPKRKEGVQIEAFIGFAKIRAKNLVYFPVENKTPSRTDS